MSVLAISSGTIAAIVVVIIIDLFAIVFGLSFVRARRAERAATAPGVPGRPTAAETPPKKTSQPVTRREFFRTSLVASLLVFGAQFGGATIAFLWPNLKGGFGSLITAGKLDDIQSQLGSGEPFYYGAGRFYIVPWNGHPDGDTDYEAEGLAQQGIMPLYQRCVHLGCRVPFCANSKWFECPCHGSKYNLAGEYELGPAPRGLDRFQVQIDETGNVLIDTSQIILGPPRGTNTIDQPPQGPFCVAPG